MEKNNLSQLEINIKALNKLGISVKHYSEGTESGSSKGLQIKDVDTSKGTVAFYYSAFNIKDSDKDLIKPGAFKKTIAENFDRIKHFKNHDTTLAAGKVLSLEEDDHGAFAVSKLSENTVGKDTLIEYQEKIITEHSMGFKTIREAMDHKTNTNIISEIMLWEVSSLTAWGANSSTPTKSDDLETTIKAIEQVLRTGNISDEGGERLQKQLAELIAKRKAAPDPRVELFKKLREGLQF